MRAAEAIAQCKARRPIVDPAISDRLMHLLSRLEAAHFGVAAPLLPSAARAAGAGPDLNAEGRKILAAAARPNLKRSRPKTRQGQPITTNSFAALASSEQEGSGSEDDDDLSSSSSSTLVPRGDDLPEEDEDEAEVAQGMVDFCADFCAFS